MWCIFCEWFRFVVVLIWIKDPYHDAACLFTRCFGGKCWTWKNYFSKILEQLTEVEWSHELMKICFMAWVSRGSSPVPVDIVKGYLVELWTRVEPGMRSAGVARHRITASTVAELPAFSWANGKSKQADYLHQKAYSIVF